MLSTAFGDNEFLWSNTQTEPT